MLGSSADLNRSVASPTLGSVWHSGGVVCVRWNVTMMMIACRSIIAVYTCITFHAGIYRSTDRLLTGLRIGLHYLRDYTVHLFFSFAPIFILASVVRCAVQTVYTVSQKKTSHFYFQHNFAICWDIFTIFDAPCSGLISAWYSLLHSHHRCEAFTWCDITRDISQAVARRAYWCRIS